jgi:hypothetical protein
MLERVATHLATMAVLLVFFGIMFLPTGAMGWGCNLLYHGDFVGIAPLVVGLYCDWRIATT